jgi:hypothetical protein
MESQKLDLQHAKELSDVLTKTISNRLQTISGFKNSVGQSQAATLLSQAHANFGSSYSMNTRTLSSPNNILGFKGIFYLDTQEVIPTHASLPTAVRTPSIEHIPRTTNDMKAMRSRLT